MLAVDDSALPSLCGIEGPSSSAAAPAMTFCVPGPVFGFELGGPRVGAGPRDGLLAVFCPFGELFVPGSECAAALFVGAVAAAWLFV
jgi:hypothetical protein